MPGSLPGCNKSGWDKPGCDKTSGEHSPTVTARKRLTESSGNGASRRRCCWAWLLTAILLPSVSVRAQTSSRPAQGCGCPDGRRFSTGASLFGKNSARVLVTGFRPQPPASASAVELTQCTELLVLGQVIRLLNTPDGRPFLKRESLKRGVIHNICDTKIHFVEAKKSYDFFQDDGSALTLSGSDAGPASMSGDANSAIGSVPEESSDEVELDENLTGRDLLQLIPRKGLENPWTIRIISRLMKKISKRERILSAHAGREFHWPPMPAHRK